MLFGSTDALTGRLPASLVLLGALLLEPASAQDYEKFEDDWRVYVGAFHATVDSKLGINGELLAPAEPVDVEDVLGMDDDKMVAWGGVSWRFAPRHSLEAELFTLNRTSSITQPFQPTLQIGDTVIESGTVGSSYDTDVYRLTYGFSAIRNERSELQLKAGLHVAVLKADLFLEGAICSPLTTPSLPPGCPPLGARTENSDVGAPLPHFGAAYSYALGPNVGLSVAAMGFALEFDSIDGSILELGADFGWQPFRHVGFAAGYRFFRVDVTSGGSELNGRFEFEYHGPMVYVQATF